MHVTHVHVDTSPFTSDSRAGVLVPMRSRRGQRAASPDTGALPQLDLGEPGNGNVEI